LDIDDDDDLFIELLKSNENLSLVALQENEEFDGLLFYFVKRLFYFYKI
jgi:hypothetical protein